MSALPSTKQVTSLDSCPPSFGRSPSARFRTLSAQSHRRIRSWLINEQVVLHAPPSPPAPSCCRAGRVYPSRRHVLQVAEHNRYGFFFQRHVGENNTGASLCRRRTGGGGGGGGGEKKQKKKQATQTAPVLLLLDETTSCLREEEPAITIAFAPKMTIHCSRVNPKEDHQFTARGLDYSSRRSGGAARNHSINLATSPRSARSPEKKQKTNLCLRP